MPDESMDGELERLARALREIPPAPRELPARVMTAVRAEHARATPGRPGARRRSTRQMLHRWEGLAAASVVAALAGTLVVARAREAGRAVAPERPVAGSGASRASAPATGATTVPFALRERGARAVAIVGDFNRWDPRATPLRASGDGTWRVELPLEPGRYAYAFLVDGERVVPDPAAPRLPDDDFGTPSSVVSVIREAR